MPAPKESAPLRRSSRVQIRIPIILSGRFQNGKPFSAEAVIWSVSKYGAKVKTLLPLEVGMQVRVGLQNRRGEGLFRVVWIGREGTPRAGEVGLECVRVSNLLGLTFPD
jgi:hypothetical protein